MIVLEIATIFILTLLAASCSLCEIAFFSLPSSRLKSYRLSPDVKKQRIASLMQQAISLIVTVFMFNTIVNILLQNSASHLFDQFDVGWIGKVGLPLFLILIFGELVPKYIGLRHNEALAAHLVNLTSFVHWIATPIRIAITSISKPLSRIFFFFLKAESPLSKDELHHILKSSTGKGLLTRDEADSILGVLALEHKQVKELMVPKSQMAMYDIEEPISKLIHLFSEHNTSEIIVVQMPQETVLGVISASSLFAKRTKITTSQDLQAILQKPFFVPETTSAKSLLHQFAHTDDTSALVIDEYGQTTGAICELDLVKQIARSKTTAPSSTIYKRVAKDAIIASGTLSVDDVNELFGSQIESAYHSVTIGGFLIEKLGSIPKSGTTYQEQNLFFRVLTADPTKIIKVYIQALIAKEGLK